jgi:aminobenzoyl-glutamate utilization protein B
MTASFFFCAGARPVLGLVFAFAAAGHVTGAPDDEALKQAALEAVEGRAKLSQEIVDSLFSFAEPGFQEFETQRYLTGILEAHGFKVERGVAGMPSAWVATWGKGKPVISLGTDVDALLGMSQKPGVAGEAPMVEGGPGHGEGHNSGMAALVPAAISVKELMEKHSIPGTLQIWPGIAEELLGGKAHYVRAGVFKDVDAVLFSHVASGLSTWWGDHRGKAMVSVEYRFDGESAHAGGSPWKGRSALDAVELMNIGWNFRREHLRPQHRSHYVITEGGGQPNVVPHRASVWYYFRETDYEQVMYLWEIANRIAEGAAKMTDTSVSWRVLGSAWPRYMNRTLAEVIHGNIQRVGMPKWSEADQEMARAAQRAVGTGDNGLSTKASSKLEGVVRIPDGLKHEGGSDDIGDICWTVPTGHISIPCNIPGMTMHHWSAAMAMATPIAHKGAVAGAKVYALSVLDLLLKPELLVQAREFFETVQGKQKAYTSFLRDEDVPPVWLNEDIMSRLRPAMREFYYDPTKHATYLEQLGIPYPPAREAGE